MLRGGCSRYQEEVFQDLEQHLDELITKKWLLGSNAVDIICVTAEEYFSDFAETKNPYKKRVRVSGGGYLRAITQNHVSSWSTKEYKEVPRRQGG